MWVTVFSSLHSTSSHRRRTIEHEGLCIRIPRFLEIYFVSSSASSKAVHLVQWSFFQRNHPSNPPFPSRTFFKLSSASASIHFASISTFTPRCVFLAQGCYLSFCPRIQRLRGRASKMPPFQAVSPFHGKTWKMALLTAKLFDYHRICSRIKVTFFVTANKYILRSDMWLRFWGN